MFEDRQARLSLRRDISDVFTSGSIFSEVYNVYTETDLREGTEIEFPHIYILDADVKFEQGQLPVIALATDYSTEEFQLGSYPFGICSADVFILGRNRGERDEFAAAIMQNVHEIHIRDFDTDGDPILATSTLLPFRGKTVWDSEKFPVTDELRTEGSLLNGVILSCQFFVCTS